jgi:predicted MFS family arabinose efflux permease
MGGLFGAQEIATVGFAGQRGHGVWAGILLALAAVGSAVSGLVYGSLPTAVPLRRQLVFFGLLAPLSVVLLPLTSNVWVLGVLMFVSGTVVSPMLICAFALVEASIPAGRLTEGLTWTVTGITLGYSLGAAVTGPAVDRLGTPKAYLVSVSFGLLTALTVVVGRRWMNPVPVPSAGPLVD